MADAAVDNLIIEDPSAQSPLQKITEAAVTTALWVIWFVLWMPLLLDIAIYIGLDKFVILPQLESETGIFYKIIGHWVEVVYSILFVVVIWSVFNQIIYRSKKKWEPTHRHLVQDHEVADYHGVDDDYLEHMQHQQRMLVHHDDNGHIAAISYSPLVDRPGRTMRNVNHVIDE